jgi:glycosyltransferase involved in cell wall biosynthesis
MSNIYRFAEIYSFNRTLGAPINIPNVRYARFPIDVPDKRLSLRALKNIWQAQPGFERALSDQLIGQYSKSGLTWGWAYPEGHDESCSRWAFDECGFFLIKPAQIHIDGFAVSPTIVCAKAQDKIVGGPWQVEGKFNVAFAAPAGEVIFESERMQSEVDDPRPLAFIINHFIVDGNPIGLATPLLTHEYIGRKSAEHQFQIFDHASDQSRQKQGISLTDVRGPFSAKMESFISDHIGKYDVLLTHNNVFRPAVYAIEEAKKNNVPSILVPHIHLDDDFYHFPDVIQSSRDASLVLAVPMAACNFLSSKGCNSKYLSAGCDTHEQFLDGDVELFHQIYKPTRPFVLVLGRKSGAKGYQSVIDAVKQVNREGFDIEVVLIGPDDDGIEVSNSNAKYLGIQPRGVVRGALQSSFALCNMSTSESFGMVILEAWLAEKPVIVNKGCTGFHDLAIHMENAMMVNPEELGSAIKNLYSDPELCKKLAKNGVNIVNKYDWEHVTNDFVEHVLEISKMKEAKFESQ